MQIERLCQQVKYDGGCWIWNGKRNSRGYGSVWGDSNCTSAHRRFYELLVGPIPKGMTIDHLCRQRLCVNPLHMDIVTNRENTMRGVGPTALHARAEVCKHGHPLDRIVFYSGRRQRRCSVCGPQKRKEYRGEHGR